VEEFISVGNRRGDLQTATLPYPKTFTVLVKDDTEDSATRSETDGVCSKKISPLVLPLWPPWDLLPSLLPPSHRPPSILPPASLQPQAGLPSPPPPSSNNPAPTNAISGKSTLGTGMYLPPLFPYQPLSSLLPLSPASPLPLSPASTSLFPASYLYPAPY
jgi:hypothetical protein